MILIYSFHVDLYWLLKLLLSFHCRLPEQWFVAHGVRGVGYSKVLHPSHFFYHGWTVTLFSFYCGLERANNENPFIKLVTIRQPRCQLFVSYSVFHYFPTARRERILFMDLIEGPMVKCETQLLSVTIADCWHDKRCFLMTPEQIQARLIYCGGDNEILRHAAIHLFIFYCVPC